MSRNQGTVSSCTVRRINTRLTSVRKSKANTEGMSGIPCDTIIHSLVLSNQPDHPSFINQIIFTDPHTHSNTFT